MWGSVFAITGYTGAKVKCNYFMVRRCAYKHNTMEAGDGGYNWLDMTDEIPETSLTNTRSLGSDEPAGHNKASAYKLCTYSIMSMDEWIMGLVSGNG